VQPRWVRVNRLKSTVEQQMSATFSGYSQTSRLGDIMSASLEEKFVYIDPHVPDLLALPPGTDLTKTQAYKNGQVILQDKASCFPASLLLDGPDSCDQGRILDACAAPGNKTTHLASILSQRFIMTDSSVSTSDRKIFACERDPYRSQTLQKMVTLAGAENVVHILAKQDFLALDPADVRFINVTHLLLDPSCSGSGIVGRDELPVLQLPKDPKPNKAGPNAVDGKSPGKGVSKKRKRQNEIESNGKVEGHEGNSASPSFDLRCEEIHCEVDSARLEKLANLQTKIIEHAFSFPAARRITYSTCSIHVHENEAVVSRALKADVARKRGWRVMREEEQPDGMRRWPYRGLGTLETEAGDMESFHKTAFHGLSEEEMRACIRCHAGNEEGTMGFFVCGFIREGKACHLNRAVETNDLEAMSHGEEEEWGGFSDDGEV
jgi:25S rRNA (cytosine2278-C5)-methyltransferase